LHKKKNYYLPLELCLLDCRLVDFFSVPVSVGSLGAPVVSFTDSVDLVDELQQNQLHFSLCRVKIVCCNIKKIEM
jgi:hypothetical protein